MTKSIEDQTQDAEFIDGNFEETPGAVDDLYEAEKDILHAFDADAKDELKDVHWQVFVSRVETGGKKDTPLFTCSPIELPVYDRVVTKYGTGDYKARIYRDKKLFRVLPFRCEAPMDAPAPTLSPANETPLVLAVQGQQVILERMLAKISETPQMPVQNNPMEMMSTVTAMMGMLREMMPAQSAVPFDPMQMFDLFTKGFEMARSNSDGDSETNIMDVIKTLIGSPMITDIAKGVPQLPPPSQATTEPLTTAPQPAPETTVEPAPDQNAIVQGLIGYMVNFIPQAERGADPGLYADLIIDNVVPEMLTQVMETPNIEQILRAAHPGIEKNWNWFASVFVYISDAVTPEGPEDLTRPEKPVNGGVQVEAVDKSKKAGPADVHKQSDTGTGASPSNGDPIGRRGNAGNAQVDVKVGKGGKKAPGNKGKSVRADKAPKK